MKILLSAYACEPGKGSEPAVGWNWTRQIARVHEIWIITRGSNRKLIERALAEEPLPNAHWIYFDLPSWIRFWKKGERGLRPYYLLWQIVVYFVARAWHRKIGFDLAHHVTLGTAWPPSFVSLLPVPFVWGPIATGIPAPNRFCREFSLRGRLNELTRHMVSMFSRWDPLWRVMKRRASLILAVSPETAKDLGADCQQKIVVFPQVGVAASELTRVSRQRPDNSSFTLLSVGRLVHWKGLGLSIKAFALFHKLLPGSEYWIIGDGPERPRLVSLSYSLGLTSALHFVGSLSREEYLRFLSQSDLLVFPSLHEPGAFVIGEAMAAGLPVICLDFGEPALLVSPETGIRISVSTPSEVVRDLSAAYQILAANPKLRDQMGRAGQKRILAKYEWNAKGTEIMRIYNSVIEETRKQFSVTLYPDLKV